MNIGHPAIIVYCRTIEIQYMYRSKKSPPRSLLQNHALRNQLFVWCSRFSQPCEKLWNFPSPGTAYIVFCMRTFMVFMCTFAFSTLNRIYTCTVVPSLSAPGLRTGLLLQWLLWRPGLMLFPHLGNTASPPELCCIATYWPAQAQRHF